MTKKSNLIGGINTSVRRNDTRFCAGLVFGQPSISWL